MFDIVLGEDGLPEPGFCSVCQNFEDIIVYFLRGTIEVSMCHLCIEHAHAFVLEWRETLPPSRA